MKQITIFRVFSLLVVALFFSLAISTSGAAMAEEQPIPQPTVTTGGDHPTPTAKTSEAQDSLPGKSSETNSQGVNPIAASTDTGDTRYIFSVPVGDGGVHYEGGDMPDSLRWGPTAIAAADDGKIWIADTAAFQLHAFDLDGKLNHTLDLQGVAVGITGVSVKDGKVWLLDMAATPPSLLQLDTIDGHVLDRQEIKESQTSGLLQIVEDARGEMLLVGGETNPSQALLQEITTQKEEIKPSLEESLSQTRDPKSTLVVQDPRSERIISVGKAKVHVQVENQIGGVWLLGRQPDDSFYLVVEEVVVDKAILVDQTIRHYGSSGELLGMARFPLQDQYVYVQESVALTHDGKVIALLTRPDRVELHELLFSADLQAILPAKNRMFPDFVSQAEADSCSLTRGQIRSNALDYVLNTTTLSYNNTDGRCEGRLKPISIQGPGTYSSVPYDWNGWVTVSEYNRNMLDGQQAGDRNTSSENCSRGVDCSGFISRIWGMTSKYSTRTLPNISRVLASNDSLGTGDILNLSGSHAVMFDHRATSSLFTIESTTYQNLDRVAKIENRWGRFNGYTPLRSESLCLSDSDDNRSIGNGQTLTGTINPADDRDTYYFDGTQGQKATIQMDKSSGSSLDSYLFLFDPDGQRVAYNDDSGGNYNALINQVALPKSGRYQIVAMSYSGYSSGQYSLKLQLQTSGQSCSTGQYLAEYFNNPSLSGSPVFTRCENQIDHDWGNGGPGNGVGNDNFSVRWTGHFNFNSGSYTFTGRADDGIRVYVDGQRIIDGWRDQPPTTYQATRNVSGDTHEVKLLYYEHGGGAYVKFGWQQDASCSSYRAEYYNNRYLSGSPVLVRCEGSILKDWRSGSPGSGVSSDNFSARWTGRFNFTGGDYTFIAQADDGIRVWLDGTLIINAWRDQPPTMYTKTRYVSAGAHSVKVEYYENGGGAVAKVWWESTQQCSNQYKAEYWNNRSISGSPVLTRCEGWPINHNWGNGSPGGTVPPDDFSARWTGQASFSQGTYKFVAVADDGVRVWLDGRLIIDGWRDQAPTTYTRTRDVSSGTHTVKVEYYEHGGGAVAQFYWERVQAGGSNLARGRTARATSYESSSYTPAKGNDGSNSTRWSSRISSTLGGQRWYVDLGSRQSFNKVRINWETAYAAYYRVVWSDDGQTWWYRPNSTEYTRSSPGWAEHTFSTVSARYVGVSMYTRAPRMNNYSFFEFEAYGSSGQNILEQQSESELQEDILPEEGN